MLHSLSVDLSAFDATINNNYLSKKNDSIKICYGYLFGALNRVLYLINNNNNNINNNNKNV